MSTKQNEELGLIVRPNNANDLDSYTADVCLTRTLGTVLRQRETASNARTYFVSNLVFSAIFEQDMALIDILATRIDGTVPTSKERASFANLIGDAIDDVLDMERSEQVIVKPDDLVIIALAKTIFYIANAPTNGNPTLKREKQKAVEMIYGRTSGRRTEPVKPALETQFVKPSWMSQLTEGEIDGEDRTSEDASDKSDL